MLNVKLKDIIRNTIFRQITGVTDIVQYVTNRKWKWAEHIARMKDNIWTIRNAQTQVKRLRSVGRAKTALERMMLWGNRERCGQG